MIPGMGIVRHPVDAGYPEAKAFAEKPE